MQALNLIAQPSQETPDFLDRRSIGRERVEPVASRAPRRRASRSRKAKAFFDQVGTETKAGFLTERLLPDDRKEIESFLRREVERAKREVSVCPSTTCLAPSATPATCSHTCLPTLLVFLDPIYHSLDLILHLSTLKGPPASSLPPPCLPPPPTTPRLSPPPSSSFQSPHCTTSSLPPSSTLPSDKRPSSRPPT